MPTKNASSLMLQHLLLSGETPTPIRAARIRFESAHRTYPATTEICA